MASGHWYSDKEIRTLGRGHSDLLRRHSRGLSFICLLLWSLGACLFSFTYKNFVNKRLPRVTKA